MTNQPTQKPVVCRGCHGGANCSSCRGAGRPLINVRIKGLIWDRYEMRRSTNKCGRCAGTGVCPGCNGSGYVSALHN